MFKLTYYLLLLLFFSKAMDAASQLKYLSKTDFTPVKAAAIQAMEDLGDLSSVENQSSTSLNSSSKNSTNIQHHPTPGLYRTRSMESGLILESNDIRTKI